MSKTPLYVFIAIASTLFISAQIDQSQSSSVSYATVQVRGNNTGKDKHIHIAYADGQEEEIGLKGSRQRRVVMLNETLNSVAAKGYHLKEVTPSGEFIIVYTFEKK